MGAISSICLHNLFSSLFLQVTGFVFLSLTSASFVKLELKYFSRIFIFLVNSAVSALASRKVPLVDGQKEGPFVSRELSPFAKCRLDMLMTLILSSLVMGVLRFLTVLVWLGKGQGGSHLNSMGW